MMVLGKTFATVFCLFQAVSGESGNAQNGESFLTSFLKDFRSSLAYMDRFFSSKQAGAGQQELNMCLVMLCVLITRTKDLRTILQMARNSQQLLRSNVFHSNSGS